MGQSKEKDYISGGGELILFQSVVVSGHIVGSLVSQLRPKQYGSPHPMAPTKHMLGVAGLEARSLPFVVVEEFVANAEVILLAQLLFQVIDNGK